MDIRTCWITVNRVCNLRCFFCYAKNTKYKKEETITIENARRIVDFCVEGKIDHIILIGGEPTIYTDLADIIKYAKENDIATSLVTNGVHLSDASYCQKILESGIGDIDVSLKGITPDDFLRVTEKDKFNQVMSGIQNLHELNANFSCSMVITKENVLSFCDGIQAAFEHGATFAGLCFAYDFCMDEKKDEEYLTKNNPYKLIADFVSQIDKLNEITKGNWSLESGFPLCVYTDEQIEKISTHLLKSCQLLERAGIIFDPQLNVIPCNTMFPLKLGKMGTDFNNYEEFCNYAESNSVYRQSIDFLTSIPSEKCLECEKLKFCGGGCVNFWTHCSFEDLEQKRERLISEANGSKDSY